MKKTFFYVLAAAGMLAYGILAYVPAPAVSAEGSTIAVVNIQQVMQEATAAKSVREQLEKKQKAFQAEISKKEEQLQKEDQELGKQRGVLAKDAFEAKANAFRKKVTEVQKEAQSKKAMLDGAFERSLGEIQKSITGILADLAKEKGFVIVIPTSQILYGDTSLDISAEVLKRLNDKLPKVEVKFDAPK